MPRIKYDRLDNDSPTEMDNLINNMELPEPTFNNGDGTAATTETAATTAAGKTSPRRASAGAAYQYQTRGNTEPVFNNGGVIPSTRRASQISNTSAPVSGVRPTPRRASNIPNGPASNSGMRPNLTPLPSLEEMYREHAGSINSDASLPEVIISDPSVTQSDSDLDTAIKRYNRKTDVQKASEFYAKVESMEREETIKCFVSSMLFILIVVFLIIIMFTMNPSM